MPAGRLFHHSRVTKRDEVIDRLNGADKSQPPSPAPRHAARREPGTHGLPSDRLGWT